MSRCATARTPATSRTHRPGGRQLLGEGRQSGAGRTHRSVADRRGHGLSRWLVGDPCAFGRRGSGRKTPIPPLRALRVARFDRWCGLHPVLALIEQSFDRTLGQRIMPNEADLRDLEAMRTVIVAPGANGMTDCTSRLGRAWIPPRTRIARPRRPRPGRLSSLRPPSDVRHSP